MALQLAAERRDHQTDGLCRTGGVGNDILCRRPRGAKVFPARAIHQRLRTGIGMDGGHGAHFYFKRIVQGFCQRGEAVGGAGCDGNNGVTGVNGVVIHAVDDGFHLTRRRRDQHFLRPGVQVRP